MQGAAGDGLPPTVSKEEELRLVFLAKQFWVWISLHCWKLISAFPGEEASILLCLAKSWHEGLQVSGQHS